MPMQEAYENKLKQGMNTLIQEVTPSNIMIDNILREVKQRKTESPKPISRVMAAACFAVILFTSVSFSPSVNALVNKMMYLIVREGNKYSIVETPYDESKIELTTAVNSPDAKEVLGQSLKLPAQIKIDGSVFKSGEYLVCSYGSTEEKSVVLQYQSSEIKTPTQLQNSLNSVFVEISKSDELLGAGDNAKEIKRGDQILYWGENPYTSRQQITEKPAEVKTYHALTWEQDGLYYKLTPGEGFDISIEVALEAMDSIAVAER